MPRISSKRYRMSRMQDLTRLPSEAVVPVTYGEACQVAKHRNKTMQAVSLVCTDLMAGNIRRIEP